MKLKLPFSCSLDLSKLPKFPKYRPKAQMRRRPRQMNASARAAQPSMDDFDETEEEPTVSLTSAFIVVLVLHIVAVGGIYAFNSIKANRRTEEATRTAMEKASAKSAKEPAAATSAATENAMPMAASPSASTTSAPAATPRSQTLAAPASSPGSHTYKVKPGDTMAKVAAANGISPALLADANGLKESAALHQGQSLTIPAAKLTAAEQRRLDQLALKAATPRPGVKTYTVVKGDNPVAIGRKLGVSAEQLMKLNSIDDPKKLRLGQVLKVPPKSVASSSNP